LSENTEEEKLKGGVGAARKFPLSFVRLFDLAGRKRRGGVPWSPVENGSEKEKRSQKNLLPTHTR